MEGRRESCTGGSCCNDFCMLYHSTTMRHGMDQHSADRCTYDDGGGVMRRLTINIDDRLIGSRRYTIEDASAEPEQIIIKLHRIVPGSVKTSYVSKESLYS